MMSDFMLCIVVADGEDHTFLQHECWEECSQGDPLLWQVKFYIYIYILCKLVKLVYNKFA